VTDASKITDYTLQGALDGDGTFGFPPDNNLDAYTDCFEGGETHTVEFVDDVGDPPDILYVTVSNERLISDEAVEYETDNGGNKYKVTFETPITCGVGEQKVEMEFSSASRTSDGTYTVSIDGSTLSLSTIIQSNRTVPVSQR